MIRTAPIDNSELATPFFPKWVMDQRVPETAGNLDTTCLEEAAFHSGAAISLLHQTLHNPALKVPQQLLRNRLALKAAKNCLKIERRFSNEGEIRDGFLLAERGECNTREQAMGPSGFMYAQWRDHVQRPLGGEAYFTNFIGTIPLHTRPAMEKIMMADQPEASPVKTATRAVQNVLSVLPLEERVALQWADIMLSRALGWKRMLPLVSCGLSGRQLRRFAEQDAKTDNLLIIAHTAIARSARDTIRLCHDLARRAAKLRAVAPRLRAKGSDAAVNLFLSADALSPSALTASPLLGSRVAMTPRAARRFCDRLVELGVVRELTGRATFRLYGVV